MGSPVATRAEGPAVEMDIAGDLVRHALPLAPVLIGASAVVWGWAGALSCGYAIALVVANFLLAAALMSWSARISLGFMMGTVLVGYAVRLALIFVAVWAVKDLWWFEAWPLGLTLIVTHLGLLFWETRHVSASLAFPGLKPPARPSPDPAAKEARR
jgi:hypothetical protein